MPPTDLKSLGGALKRHYHEGTKRLRTIGKKREERMKLSKKPKKRMYITGEWTKDRWLEHLETIDKRKKKGK